MGQQKGSAGLDCPLVSHSLSLAVLKIADGRAFIRG